MSNVDIVRNVTAELATRTKAQVTGWRWADGVVVFPDIRCPYCKQGVRSPAIWKHTKTTLIGQVVPQMGVTPELEKPNHAHVTTAAGGICFGKARTAYQALFGALNGTPNYEHMVGPFLRGPLMGHHHCEEMDAIKENLVSCINCGDTVDEDGAYWFNANSYCADCFNDIAFNCWNCGDAYSVDERKIGSDDYDYCPDCWSTRFFECAKCDTVSSIDVGSYDTPIGDCCEDCYSDNYFGCENCEETTDNSDRADYDDESLCQTCFDAKFTRCADCDEVYKNDDGHECPEAEEAKEPHDDYPEGVLLAADNLIDTLIEADPENELLARVKEHTYQRYLVAPGEK
jgi:hypothetical protein